MRWSTPSLRIAGFLIVSVTVAVAHEEPKKEGHEHVSTESAPSFNRNPDHDGAAA